MPLVPVLAFVVATVTPVTAEFVLVEPVFTMPPPLVVPAKVAEIVML